jgi:hypothetical protein
LKQEPCQDWDEFQTENKNKNKNGGRYWIRTSDLHNVNVMRYQLRQPPKHKPEHTNK